MVSALLGVLTMSAGCTARLSAIDASPEDDSSGSGVGQDSASGPSKPTPTPDSPGPVAPTPALVPDAPPQPLRRVSSEQYHQIVLDLMPPSVGPALVSMSLFPETIITQGFSADAAANLVSTAHSHRIEDNAERMADALLARADEVYPQLDACIPQGFSDAQLDACVDGFIQEFGLRAYRRPLTQAERQIARDLYDAVRQAQSAREAFAALLQLFLQAPALLYRVERGGQPVQGLPQLRHLTDWEMASRLSFFFLGSGPDQALRQAAAAGQLSTPAQVQAQARRLAQTPRAKQVMGAFLRDWLKLYLLRGAQREGLTLDLATRQALLREGERLLTYVVEQGDGSLASLLGAATMPVAPELGALYGVQGADGGPRQLEQRRGLLTTVSFMMAHSHVRSTNPIERGAFLLKEVLCSHVPPLPGDVDLSAPLEATSHLPTARERLAPLTERNDCAGCHMRINPPGLAMERFDHLGRWRTHEGGVPIDASGLLRERGLELRFETSLELVEALAAERVVHDCYALQAFRFAQGRYEAAADAHALAQLQERFWDAGGDLTELLVALTQTEAFLYRRPHAQE